MTEVLYAVGAVALFYVLVALAVVLVLWAEVAFSRWLQRRNRRWTR